MSAPIAKRSLDQATATGAGEDTLALGHTNASVIVATDVDPTTLTVTVEASPDQERWATVRQANGSELTVTESEVAEDPESGAFTAHLAVPPMFLPWVRLRVTDYGSAGNVDGWVCLSGNPGQGRKAHGAEGPVTDL